MNEKSIVGKGCDAANQTPTKNVDRLRAHLKTDSLAIALLGEWEKGANAEQRRAKMLAALQSESTGKDSDDVAAQIK